MDGTVEELLPKQNSLRAPDHHFGGQALAVQIYMAFKTWIQVTQIPRLSAPNYLMGLIVMMVILVVMMWRLL